MYPLVPASSGEAGRRPKPRGLKDVYFGRLGTRLNARGSEKKREPDTLSLFSVASALAWPLG